MANYETTEDPYATKIADWTDMRKLVSDKDYRALPGVKVSAGE